MFKYRRFEQRQEFRSDIQEWDEASYWADFDYDDDDLEDYTKSWYYDWLDSGARYQFAQRIYDGTLEQISSQLKNLERSKYCSRTFKDIIVGDFVIEISTHFSDSGFLSKSVRMNTKYNISVHTTTSDMYSIMEDPRFRVAEWEDKLVRRYGYLKPFTFDEFVRFCKYCFKVTRLYSML